MAFSRRLGVIWIAGASWLVAVGCDDDGDQISSASAGEGGEAPSGGKSAAAGSQNNGGKAGATAGTAGTGASPSSGAGGGGGDAGNGASAGSAGQAGSGGEAAGAGGVGGEAGGGLGGIGGATGGQGGEGGAPGPVAVAAHCSFTCASDDDCVIDGDDAIKCNLTTHRCEDPAEACTVDANCQVSMSFWFKPCTTDANCTANTEACVDAGGEGFCAPVPGAGVPACTGSNVSKTLPRFGAQGTVAVCAHPDARCFAGLCRAGCGDPNAGCGLGNGDTCSATTGLCGCASGTECTATGVCGSDGQCQECTTDDECAQNVTDTVCVGGKCGCATSTACEALDPGYASAPAACQ